MTSENIIDSLSQALKRALVLAYVDNAGDPPYQVPEAISFDDWKLTTANDKESARRIIYKAVEDVTKIENEADIIIELKQYLRDEVSYADTIIRYDEADHQLKLSPGSTQKYIYQAINATDIVIIERGTSRIILRKKSEPYEPSIWEQLE